MGETNPEREAFARVMAALHEIYGDKFPLTKDVMEVWWRLFSGRGMRLFGQAVAGHITDSERGRWPPRPADIIASMDGPKLTADELIAEARLAMTPIGVLARLHIGSYDLQNGSSYHLHQRGHEAVLLQDQWKQKIRAGEFTDHERACLEKHGVDAGRAKLECPVERVLGVSP